MEPDKDPQEHALELSPENQVPAQAAPDSPVQAAQSGAEAVAETPGVAAPAAGKPRLSLARRILEALEWPLGHLKKILRLGALWLVTAVKGILQRFKRGAKTPEEKDDTGERRKEKDADDGNESRPARKKAEPSPATETVKTDAPRSKVRSFFIYLLVLLIGGFAGMTFSSAVLWKMLANQAEKIVDQRDEIVQMENQMARLQESEAKYRRENTEQQKKLKDAETQLHAATQNSGKNPPPAMQPAIPSVPAAAKPPAAAKGGECVLEPGKIGDNLTRCIKEFNRK
ncbi:MAG: hypothetical protein HY066_06385 [Betaproteobacteria bacterium]|nr:hypothetical protein [Betaproteobacteria bacterium]